ncbi:hypothetical protein C9I98_24775 [Photobacterium sanctipauli]|uniref:PEP-CTERM sorting domain-containing protein n=1 Tax=Photobacterium sanctipauli TaxID=1342794 RepID=A0A2T3NAH5_9GAMM|nr:hypothetical protein [Photobacterium sanctipauli]PSW10740.1 hypothetical protein C9I98_24775 [Photobacterium sanctipauli]
MKKSISIAIGLLATVSLSAQATLVSIENCSGTAKNGPAVTCEITNSPANVISPNPNNNKLVAWDEVQNHVLVEDLKVDRVFDPTASFIEDAGNSGYFIKAGTIVSSHYVQWDPNGRGQINASIVLDSQIFAFITSDQNLFDSDDQLALPNINYNDFNLRGIEKKDTTVFDGDSASINWTASSPGDWARLITAYSPAAEAQVSEPVTIALFLSGLIGFVCRRKVTN